MELIVAQANNVATIALIAIGFYGMIAKGNLIKKIIGMNIFQWSIILYVVSLGAKRGAAIPIVPGYHHGAHDLVVHAADHVNPLPHVLMLTAIVVGVATTSVALALALRVYQRFGTLEEAEILAQLREEDRQAREEAA
jgi:multicomponent Na+:H+ antiporter subunit C